MSRRDKDNSPLVPRVAASRLSRYLRRLEELSNRGETTTSSQELGKALGVTAAQVRKDLGHFGQFGFPGLGYKISNLVPQIKSILGTDRAWNVAMVGIGNLGNALLRYKGFQAHGFRIAALLDNNPRLTGRTLEGLTVEPIEALERIVAERSIELSILSVPASAAQGVADRLVRAGVRGIYNFAPVQLTLPDAVAYVSIDLAVELEQLAFLVRHREREPGRRSGPAT